jgi:hypothetical protein
MVGPGFTSVGVSNDLMVIIKNIIQETKLYRNPTEFITFAIHEKIDEIQKRQIDQKKLEAFFIREKQIRSEHLM